MNQFMQKIPFVRPYQNMNMIRHHYIGKKLKPLAIKVLKGRYYYLAFNPGKFSLRML